MRRAAAEGLGRLADRSRWKRCRTFRRRDRADDVRLAAAFAVDRLGEPQTHVLAAHLILRDVGAQARDYLLEIGRPALAGHSRDPGGRERRSAPRGPRPADRVCRDARRVGWLETFLADRDERVRRAAADAIARLKR